MKQIQGDKSLKPLQILQYVVFSSIILYFGKEIFVPISFALLISFVSYPLCQWLECRGFGRSMSIIIGIGLVLLTGTFLAVLLIYQMTSFLNEWPLLQVKIAKSVKELSDFFVHRLDISMEQQQKWIAKISNQSTGNILAVLKTTITASASSAILLVLVPIYSLLILLYRRHWMRIVHSLFPYERKEKLVDIVLKTIKTYYNFIKGMALVYLIVGILNSIGLLLLGIPHAILFGFIASILTFIPYVGIMVGALLPIAVSWITYDSIWYPLGVVGIFAFVQYLEANVIFPFAVSSRLNVNTLIMLIAIFLGGVLWGVAGMILFVPFVGIAKLIADHKPEWRTLSLILGMESEKKERSRKLNDSISYKKRVSQF